RQAVETADIVHIHVAELDIAKPCRQPVERHPAERAVMPPELQQADIARLIGHGVDAPPVVAGRTPVIAAGEEKIEQHGLSKDPADAAPEHAVGGEEYLQAERHPALVDLAPVADFL